VLAVPRGLAGPLGEGGFDVVVVGGLEAGVIRVGEAGVAVIVGDVAWGAVVEGVVESAYRRDSMNVCRMLAVSKGCGERLRPEGCQERRLVTICASVQYMLLVLYHQEAVQFWLAVNKSQGRTVARLKKR
jgi:hypothetical protein